MHSAILMTECIPESAVASTSHSLKHCAQAWRNGRRRGKWSLSRYPGIVDGSPHTEPRARLKVIGVVQTNEWTNTSVVCAPHPWRSKSPETKVINHGEVKLRKTIDEDR